MAIGICCENPARRNVLGRRAPCSDRRVASRLDPNVLIGPVGFPGLAAIVRKRLFGLCGVVRDFPYRKSHPDVAPVDLLLIIEVAASILALSNPGYFSKHTNVRSGEVEIPFAGIGVEPAHS